MDSELFDGDYNFVGDIKKNTIVKLWNCSVTNQKSNSEIPFDYSVRIKIENQKRLVDYNVLIPLETTDLFAEDLISHKLKENEKYWSSTTVVDLLKSNTRENYYKINKEKIEAYENRRGIYDEMEWYEGVCFNEQSINNVFIILSDDIKYTYYYFVKRIEKIKDGYKVKCELCDLNVQEISYVNETLEELRNQKEIVYKLIIDGDYINFYSDNNLLFSLVLVDKSIVDQYENLFHKGKADLSRVIWPRHADGTCDYDNSSITKTVVSRPSTNVAPNKIMSVSENLKLRSGEATSTTVLIVMQAGTKVKILELGKSETIDGINSNWVKVEVLSGKDRDGKEIKKKTTGWCYGGYLK